MLSGRYLAEFHLFQKWCVNERNTVTKERKRNGEVKCAAASAARTWLHFPHFVFNDVNTSLLNRSSQIGDSSFSIPQHCFDNVVKSPILDI